MAIIIVVGEVLVAVITGLWAILVAIITEAEVILATKSGHLKAISSVDWRTAPPPHPHRHSNKHHHVTPKCCPHGNT